MGNNKEINSNGQQIINKQDIFNQESYKITKNTIVDIKTVNTTVTAEAAISENNIYARTATSAR
jgi:hypothetical protein